MAQASEEDTSECDDLGDSSDIWAREVAAFALQNHRVYMALVQSSYKEKQRINRQLKEEALRRHILDEKSEAYFRGWDDAYRFYTTELHKMSDESRQAAIKEQEESMKRNSAREKEMMNRFKRKREVEQPDDRDAQGRGKGRGSASSAGTGPTSVPHRPENPSSNTQVGGSASSASSGL